MNINETTKTKVTFKPCGHSAVMPDSAVWDAEKSAPVNEPIMCPECGKPRKDWQARVIR